MPIKPIIPIIPIKPIISIKWYLIGTFLVPHLRGKLWIKQAKQGYTRLF